MKINKTFFGCIAPLFLTGALAHSTIVQSKDMNFGISESNNYLESYNTYIENITPRISQLSEKSKKKSYQLIVKFKESYAPAKENKTLKQFSITKIKDLYKPSKKLAKVAYLIDKIKVISFAKGSNIGKAFQDLLKDPAVEYVAPNHAYELQATTPNDLSEQLWGLNNTGQTRTFVDPYGNTQTKTGTTDVDIDAPEAWDINHDASNTIIAVIDTGIDYNHPELAANIWINPGEIADNGIDDDGNGYIDDVHGYDFADNDSDPIDVQGHGTHCSGTIAAQGNNGNDITGIAWNTQLMALKIFGDNEEFAYTTDIMNAILYAADMGAKVSNNSYGSTNLNGILANIYEKPVYDAISAANEAGMLFVAAAGNKGKDLDTHWISTPSGLELPNIISVAASDHNDEPAIFTNYGKTLVDIAAPGVDIYSTLPGNEYGTWSGTSMAGPHVTGAAALMVELNPELTPAEIKAFLMNESDKPDSLADISGSGGRLNLHKALSAIEGGDGCQNFTSTNDEHVANGRATKTSSWFYSTYYAVGSNESLGYYGTTSTTLYENSPGYFSKIEDCQVAAVDAPPVITLQGDLEKFILVGSDYTLPTPAATAFDREDGDITASITTTGSFDLMTEGRYIITYNVTDSAGNKAAPISRFINVLERDTPPEVFLNGEVCGTEVCDVMKMQKDTVFQDPGYLGYDLIDGDITEDVFIIDNPMGDTSEIGLRFLTYDVTDSAGNHSASQHIRRFVAVLDENEPHIWLRQYGNFNEWHKYAYEFTTWKRPEGKSWYYRADYNVLDLNTEQIDMNITVTGEDAVDYNTAGDYTVEITATDTDGYSTTATQIVHVVDDVTPPQIYLNGEPEVTIEIGDYYTDLGGRAVDDLDFSPKTSIKYYDSEWNEIEAPFHSTQIALEEGTFYIEFLAEDGTGNQATPQYRTIHVVRSHWDHSPIFNSYRIRSGYTAEISGHAFDIDGDLNRVEIEFDEDGNWLPVQGTFEDWIYEPDFYGERTVKIRAVDNNGNITITQSYDFASRAPVIIESHNVQVTGTTAVISGTASDEENDIEKIQVSIDFGPYIDCEGTTSWSCTFAGLSFGTHSYRVRGKDKYYSPSTPYRAFIVSANAPQVDSYDYTIEGDSLVVTGTASDIDDDLSKVELTSESNTILCQGTTSFTCTLPNLVDGTTYTVSLTATDDQGLTSPETGEYTFTYSAGPACITATNQEHINADRANLQYGVLVYANGSNNYLGLTSATTSLEETSQGYWAKVNVCN